MKAPPIMGERSVKETKDQEGNTITDTIYHSIPSFELIANTGQKVTLENYKNQIFVTNFFFATCKTICPKMSGQMKRLQNIHNPERNIDFKMLSITVDPVHDTIEALNLYAQQYEADPKKWLLATGKKEEIYNLARKGFLLPVGDGDGGEHDFIHSEMFVLVDMHQRIRGFYDGTDSNQVKKLADDIVLVKLQEEKLQNKKKKWF